MLKHAKTSYIEGYYLVGSEEWLREAPAWDLFYSANISREAVLIGQGSPIRSRVIHQKIWRQRIIDAKGLSIICRLGHMQIEWWDKDSFQRKCPWRNSSITFSEVIMDHRSGTVHGLCHGLKPQSSLKTTILKCTVLGWAKALKLALLWYQQCL